MSYILGVAIGHNSSVALLKDGELVLHIEEERLSRVKRDGNPFKALLKVLEYTKEIDTLVLSATTPITPTPWNGTSYYVEFLEKLGATVKNVIDVSDKHHLMHATNAFLNSGFNDATVVVIDGAGSELKVTDTDVAYEAESIFKASASAGIQRLHLEAITNNVELRGTSGDVTVAPEPTIVKMYEGVTQLLGWHPIEAGKTMGLAAYGKFDSRIPQLYTGNRGKLEYFEPHYPATTSVTDTVTAQVNKGNPEGFAENIARKIQYTSEQLATMLVSRAIAMNPSSKHICISGGYGLNVVNNAKLLQKFPDYEFWFEPTCNDSGNSIGAAKYGFITAGGDINKVRGIDNYYTGGEYTADDVVPIYEYMVTKPGNLKEIAKLVDEGEIVALYQGRSEAGPRALGNRSFLFNPTLHDGKDSMNRVKKREYFRPFACSVLEEDLSTLWDPIGITSSPYMMVAFPTTEDVKAQIPAVVHHDLTTRVQTVTREQNKVLYDILVEYKKLSGVGVLGNTSFNLSGEPLVETVEDALHTLDNAEFKYIYFADQNLLVTKKETNGK